MEYIMRASFVEIYGLMLAYPISLLTKFYFDIFKAHITQHPYTLGANGFGVLF